MHCWKWWRVSAWAYEQPVGRCRAIGGGAERREKLRQRMGPEKKEKPFVEGRRHIPLPLGGVMRREVADMAETAFRRDLQCCTLPQLPAALPAAPLLAGCWALRALAQHMQLANLTPRPPPSRCDCPVRRRCALPQPAGCSACCLASSRRLLLRVLRSAPTASPAPFRLLLVRHRQVPAHTSPPQRGRVSPSLRLSAPAGSLIHPSLLMC